MLQLVSTLKSMSVNLFRFNQSVRLIAQARSGQISIAELEKKLVSISTLLETQNQITQERN